MIADPRPPMRVFPDTGALVAMLVFPRDRSGSLTLAGEVLQLYEEGKFTILLSRVVMDELEEVITGTFQNIVTTCCPCWPPSRNN